MYFGFFFLDNVNIKKIVSSIKSRNKILIDNHNLTDSFNLQKGSNYKKDLNIYPSRNLKKNLILKLLLTFKASYTCIVNLYIELLLHNTKIL